MRKNKEIARQEAEEWEKPLEDGSIVSGPIEAFNRILERDYADDIMGIDFLEREVVLLEELDDLSTLPF